MFKVIEILEIISLSTYNIYVVLCKSSWSSEINTKCILVQPKNSNTYHCYHYKDKKCL